MLGYFAVVGLFMTMFGLMALSLYFSQFRKTGAGCCSAGLEELQGEADACYTCPKRETEECQLPASEETTPEETGIPRSKKRPSRRKVDADLVP